MNFAIHCGEQILGFEDSHKMLSIASFVTGLYDRDPLPKWTVGRATLLDSAHPMLPYLAQGACQALEDGYVLARCLARWGIDGIPDALADYEIRRRPRTTKVQAGARAAHIFWTEQDPVQARANGWMQGLAQIGTQRRYGAGCMPMT